MRPFSLLLSALFLITVHAIPIDGNGNGSPEKSNVGGNDVPSYNIEINLQPFLGPFSECLKAIDGQSKAYPPGVRRDAFWAQAYNQCIEQLIMDVEAAMMAALPPDASEFAKQAVPQLSRRAVTGWLRGDTEDRIVEFSVPSGSGDKRAMVLNSVVDAARGVRDNIQAAFSKQRPSRHNGAIDGYAGPGGAVLGRLMLKGRPL